MSTQLDPIVAQAIRHGILPEGATSHSARRGNWPLVLLSFLGAWLVVLPFAAFLGLLFGKWIFDGSGAPVLGIPLLGGAIALLRQDDDQLPLFVEQLALPALLLGGGLLGYALFDHLPGAVAALTLSAVALTAGWLTRSERVRVLLGGLACLLFLGAVGSLPALVDVSWGRALYSEAFLRVGLLVAVAAWALLDTQAQRFALSARKADHAIFLDRTLLGWVCAALFGLSVASGRTFLFSELLPGDGFNADAALPGAEALLGTIGCAMTLLGMWLLTRAWPTLRAVWLAAPAVVVAALSVAMPALGPCLLVACIAARERRWGLASCAGLAALWIVGGFYYALDYPLALKAGMLFGAALLLAVPVWWRLRGRLALPGLSPTTVPTMAPMFAPAFARPLLALSCAAVLAVVNIGIWQKERLIGASQVLYVELAPVDPRSLMQGDFMRLAFALPPQAQPARASALYAVGTVDPRKIIHFSRYQEHARVQPGEVAMRLAYKHGQWILVTDAWFFEEGTAKKWESARYGEFRVDRDGSALLVGMRNQHLGAL